MYQKFSAVTNIDLYDKDIIPIFTEEVNLIKNLFCVTYEMIKLDFLPFMFRYIFVFHVNHKVALVKLI